MTGSERAIVGYVAAVVMSGALFVTCLLIVAAHR